MKILIKTGFGYYKNQLDQIVAKAQLPAGEHDLSADLVYTEVDSQAELDAIQVYQDPADIKAAQQNKKIADKLRALAIESLVSDGDWP